MVDNKGDATKLHLIMVGAELIHQQGFNNTGIAHILKKAEVAKGSFYFHFTDKEAFGLAVLDHYVERMKSIIQPIFMDDTLSAVDKLFAFHEKFLQIFTELNFSHGCLIGNLSQEMSDISPVFSKKISAILNSLTFAFQKVIEQGIANKEFNSTLEPVYSAAFLVDSWEGALLRMKVQKSAQPLENWFVFVKEILIKK